MTIAYFTISLTCLWMSSEELSRFVALFGITGLFKIYVTLTLATMASIFTWDRLLLWCRPRAGGVRMCGFIGGFVFLFLLWGDVGGIVTMAKIAIGLDIPVRMLSVAGAVPLMLGIDVAARHDAVVRLPSLATQAVWVVLLLLASLMSAGSVPEFVYKGF